jgi:pyrroloquinoline quinone biosynthesis protein E
LQIIKGVLDDFKKIGGATVELSGGEPLCHQHVSHIIAYAKQLGLETRLFSCGIFDPSQLNGNADVLQKKVEELKSLGIDQVFVTLHGSNEEVHNQISGQPSFGPTTGFIKELVRQQVPVGVHFVPVQLNFDNIDDVKELFSRLGVQEVGLLRFVPQGRGERNIDLLRLRGEQMEELAVLLAQEMKRKSIVRVGRHLDFTFLINKNHRPGRCIAGLSKCLVTSEGEVLPCPVFKGLDDFVAGNVKNNGLEDIWKNSPTFMRLRDFDPRRIKGLCAHCEYLDLCRGRCPAQRYYEYKNRYGACALCVGPDPYCPRAAQQKRATIIS